MVSLAIHRLAIHGEGMFIELATISYDWGLKNYCLSTKAGDYPENGRRYRRPSLGNLAGRPI